MRTIGIVLAAGSGKRMNSTTKKQFMELAGKPVIYYGLKVFEESFIDEIILVTSKDDIEYCQKEIVEKYGFNKVSAVISGGRERYHSVYEGLKAARDCDYVFIHDGARAFVDADILDRTLAAVVENKACVAGMPCKDTIKLSNQSGFVDKTLDRRYLWTIQTPQVFDYSLIRKCYDELIEREEELIAEGVSITDDTMVVEAFSDTQIKLVEGSYNNIKITTPEDIVMGEAILRNRER